MKKNFKSDFHFIMKLFTPVRKEDGTIEKVVVGWPEHDWTARLFTSIGLNTYIASRKGEALTNCFNDNGRIHIVCNNHKLGKGRLQVEFHSEIPNAIYPDGIEDLYEPQRLDIELVDGPGDCATTAEVEVMMPYIKGDKGEAFTYADFTPAQIAELQRPATEKVAEVTTALTRVETKEREITKAEQLRQSAEKDRVAAEQERAEQFATLKQSIETATTDANTAAGSAASAAVNAQTAANTANTAANLANEAASNIAAAKIALFDDMWASIGGTKLDNGNYRKTAAGKELTLAEALIRYRLDGFIKLWNAACIQRYYRSASSPPYGKYNETTCCFELNGFTDIGFEEAARIYSAYVSGRTTTGYRTNIPIGMANYPDSAADIRIFTNTEVEKIRGTFLSSTAEVLNTGTLKEIQSIRLGYGSNSVYIQSASLEIIYFSAQNATHYACKINIPNAANFRIDGIEQIVNWVNNSTVIVHPDVYAKLTGDTTNEAAAALTEEELAQWQEMAVRGAEYNIAFAAA